MTHTEHTTQPALPRRASFWASHIGNFISQKISARIKRLIFLSSVVGFLKDISSPDKDMLVKLNKVLKLAHNDDAIILPFYVHSWLWKKCEINTAIEINGQQVPLYRLLDMRLNTASFDNIAAYFIEKAPKWIIYGPEKTIAHDLEVLFSTIPALRH